MVRLIRDLITDRFQRLNIRARSVQILLTLAIYGHKFAGVNKMYDRPAFRLAIVDGEVAIEDEYEARGAGNIIGRIFLSRIVDLKEGKFFLKKMRFSCFNVGTRVLSGLFTFDLN